MTPQTKTENSQQKINPSEKEISRMVNNQVLADKGWLLGRTTCFFSESKKTKDEVFPYLKKGIYLK